MAVMTELSLVGLIALIGAGDAGTTAERMKALQMTVRDQPVTPLPDPVLRYSDPTRDTNGTVWAWGRPGRPVALLTLTDEPLPAQLGPPGGRLWYYEFVALSNARIKVSGGEDWTWQPQGGAPRMSPLPDTTAPAETERLRGRQMRLLAKRFSANESYQGETYELRLLETPIHRYADPQNKLVDGAIFAFAHGTNPEVVLLLEAQETPSGLQWRYGFARMGAATLSVSLNEREVFSEKPFHAANTNTTAPYNAFREIESASSSTRNLTPR
jgi:hypothetical protein